MPQFDPSDAHKEIGKQLRKFRIAAGKSIKDAAIYVGVGARTLSKIEDGETDFHILTLEKLCKFYNIAPSQLLKDFTLSHRQQVIAERRKNQNHDENGKSPLV